MDESCETCRFGLEAENEEKSIVCRRFPPFVTKAEGTVVTSTFPILARTGWCGEYQVKIKGWINPFRRKESGFN